MNQPIKDQIWAPSYLSVLNAARRNTELGHENLGFLSFDKGFMPVNQPLQNLPPEFSAWDNLASNLPVHYKNQTLRRAFRELPVLDFSKQNLGDKYLCRASVLASMFAHAYVRCEREEDLDIPNTILLPWQQITQRLNRPVPFLSYIDLIVYNWKLKNQGEDFEVENLSLLVPTVDNNEERIFYLTQTEILYKSHPIVKEVAEVQTAILQDNEARVISGLQKIQRVIEDLTEDSFLKINPNPRSKTYVDPIVWAKTVAPFAVPLKEGVQGPSGTSSPVFHLIDTFIERAKYDTILGEEALFIRRWYPTNWREFLNAVEQVSLSGYIEKKNNDELNGAYYSLIEAYAGKQGFLGVHKRKVYGYLQMAFKVGRSVTIGGFSGLFKERTWEDVDDELEKTRLERFADKQLKCPFATISNRKQVSIADIKNIELNIENKGVNYRPGDRIAILPSNNEELVNEILLHTGLAAQTTIRLNEQWQQHIGRYYHIKTEELSLREVLQLAKLSKVELADLKEVPKAIQACLEGIKRAKITLGLKEFIEVLVGHGLPVNLLASGYLLTDLLTIESERLYSISSEDRSDKKETVELTVGKVKQGVASGFLHDSYISSSNKIPFRIVRPLRFKLPENLDKPILMFAGGTGISPFKAFWEHLESKDKLHLGWLFLSVQDIKSFPYQDELQHLSLEKDLNLNVVFSRQDIQINKEISREDKTFAFEPGQRGRMERLLAQKEYQKKLYELIKPERIGGKGAYIYVCGKSGFAKSIMDAIQNIIKIYAIAEEIDPKELFYELFSEDRYMQDIFTSKEEVAELPRRYAISEIVKRNNEKNGYWILVNKKVYDLTEFKDIHPGGEKIVLDNAGRDGTKEFQRAEHHLNPEILSLLSMYYVGESIEPQFESVEVANKYQSWLEAMHLTTEMQNTLYTDYTFTYKKTTRVDTSSRFTPFKAALIIENHKRFHIEYIPLLIESLIHQFNEEEDYHKILRQFKDVSIQEAESLKGTFNTDTLAEDEELRGLLLSVEKADKELIVNIRNLFWAGLKYFESYEADLKPLFNKNMNYILELFIEYLDSYTALKSKFGTKISTVQEQYFNNQNT
ncbi:cytochrome b5 domain-containing protein [Desertivirga brevis]|uniref:cytochrome b5 domain-containing protein n=1 Tax=Desertivirga brevis TaxID=2810310 RepID=UPI001A964CFB|nr:cytochrome b5 domain-containing protein [Pedobacter sp. SYSU D00873]